eukprot:jgi/Ulvmu1/6498/UM003_0131.1
MNMGPHGHCRCSEHCCTHGLSDRYLLAAVRHALGVESNVQAPIFTRKSYPLQHHSADHSIEETSAMATSGQSTVASCHAKSVSALWIPGGLSLILSAAQHIPPCTA